MYTGVLEQDATEEQIIAAKKTVQIAIEVNGHKYVQSFDGTKGLAVLVDTGEATIGARYADGQSTANFVSSLMRDMPRKLCLMLLIKQLEPQILMGAGKKLTPCPDCGEIHPDITFDLFKMGGDADESGDQSKRAG